MRLGVLVLAFAQAAVAQQSYFPARGQWQARTAAAVDLDSAKLQAAVDYALTHGSSWDFDRDQVRTFGPPLGPLPKQRASTNGLVIRHGYIVAEFGDTLGGIAAKTGVSLTRIQELNPNVDPHAMVAGQQIRLK